MGTTSAKNWGAWALIQDFLMVGQSWRRTSRAIYFLIGLSFLAGCLDGPYDGPVFPLLPSYASNQDSSPVLLSSAALSKAFEVSPLDTLIETGQASNQELDTAKELVTEAERIQRTVPQTTFVKPQARVRWKTGDNWSSRTDNKASPGLNGHSISIAGGKTRSTQLMHGSERSGLAGVPPNEMTESNHPHAIVKPKKSHACMFCNSHEDQLKHVKQVEYQMVNLYSVSNSDDLMNALASAVGGDTIELVAGDYGALTLNHQTDFDVTYDSPVTIVSADPENPASLSSMNMAGVSNIVLDNIHFDYDYKTDDVLWHKPFRISDSSNITIKNSLFDGDVASGTGTPADGYGTGFGLSVWYSSGVEVDNTEFKSWWKGMAFSRSTDLTISNNDIHDIRSDGINLGEAQSVLIEGNRIHDFRVSKESGDHADMIQVLATTHATTATADLTIRDNILDIGEGDITQMIFMANGKYDQTQDDSWLYQNVLIEDNLIRGSQVHGISAGATDGVTIRNNTLIDAQHPDGSAAPIIRTNNSINVLIEDNAVPGIANADDPEPTWTILNNFILQTHSPELAGYYEDQFITSSVSNRVETLVVNPDGELATLDAGVTWMGLDTSPEAPLAQFDIRSKGIDSNTLVFDASHTYGPGGVVEGDNAEFQWTFGDGTTAMGQIVEHRFGTAGIYDVTLQLVLPDGTTVTAESDARITGSDVLTFNPSDGAFYRQSYGEETALAGTDVASVVSDSDGMTVDLSASENLTQIRSHHLQNLLGSKSFDISMEFQADEPWVSQGWLLHFKSVLTVKTNQSGDILAEVWDDDGSRFTLSSSGLKLNDGGIHSFGILLDDESDTLQLVVDGAARDSVEFNGQLSQGISHSLKFGSPWGGSFDGQMHSFDLDVVASDYSDYEGTNPIASVPDDTDAVVVDEEDASENPVDLTPDPEDNPTDSSDPDVIPDEEPDTTAPENSPEEEVPAESDAQITGSDVLTFNPNDGTFYLHSDSEETALAGTDVASVVSDSDGMTVDLSASENLTQIRAHHLKNFLGSKSFDISMEFQADQPGVSQGWLLHLKSVLTVRTNQSGDILVDVRDDAGSKFMLASSGLNLNDGGVHSFGILLDDESDMLQLVVDGVARDSAEFSGQLSQGMNHSLKFGSPWGGSFDGQMHSFDLHVVASESSEHDGTSPTASVPEDTDAVVVDEEDASENPVDLTPDPEDNPTDSSDPDVIPDEEPDTTAPETSPEEEAAPLWKLDGFEIFKSLEKQDHDIKFGHDAHASDLQGQSAIILDGNRDYVKLGRIEEYENSEKVTVDLEFQRNDPDGHDTLLFNKGRLGVTMNGDTLSIKVGQADRSFSDGFSIKNSGLDDPEETHNLRVIVDGSSDRLQVVLNGEVVLDDSSRDLDLIQSGSGNWGYMIGTPWSSTFDGAVTGLEIDDSAHFIPEDPMLSV